MILSYQLNHFMNLLKQKLHKESPLLQVNTLHICDDILHYIYFVVSKINVTDDDVITEPDVKEKFPRHVQPVPSTSEGKFNINIAVLYFEPLNEIFGKLF